MTYLSPEARSGFIKQEIFTRDKCCPGCLAENSWERSFESRAGTIFMCNQCGIGRTAKIDRNLILNQFSDRNEDVRSGIENYVADRSAREASASNLLTKVERLIDPGNLLEFGCHVGFLLSQAKKRGWCIEGVDPNPYAIEWGQQHLGLAPLTTETLEEYPLDGNLQKFDAVVLANLLGHLDDPRAAVLKINKMIKPGGILVIQTPRFDNPLMSFPNFIRKNWRYFISTYFWYFNLRGIRLMLDNCGFEVQDISVSQRSISLDYAAERLLELARIDCLEPLELRTRLSMRRVYDLGVKSVDSLRNRSLGQYPLDLEFFKDSIDVVARKSN